MGLQKEIALGNLDWGFAGDFVETTWTPMSPRALITAVAGQDGNIPARRLAQVDYEVVRTAQAETDHTDIDDIPGQPVVEAAFREENVCRRIVYDIEPDAVFHFAGIPSVTYSWSHPIETAAVSGQSVGAIIDSLLDLQNSTGKERIFGNASSAKGDASKAKAELGWEPTKRFADVVATMVEHDLALIEGQLR